MRDLELVELQALVIKTWPAVEDEHEWGRILGRAGYHDSLAAMNTLRARGGVPSWRDLEELLPKPSLIPDEVREYGLRQVQIIREQIAARRGREEGTKPT